MTAALLVLAGAADGAARGFVARQAAQGAVLLTPRDLSRPGWRLRVGDVAASVAVAGGRRIPGAGIKGVLTRLPAITPQDLPHIAREDRAYVAAEMTAFLLAFLSELGSLVANRPTPPCLCGPAWTATRWRQVARELGFPVEPVRLSTAPEVPEAGRQGAFVTVLGDTCPGAPCPALAHAATALARAAGVEMLAVEFAHGGADAPVRCAHLLPDLAVPGGDEAVLRLFGLGAARSSRALP